MKKPHHKKPPNLHFNHISALNRLNIKDLTLFSDFTKNHPKTFISLHIPLKFIIKIRFRLFGDSEPCTPYSRSPPNPTKLVKVVAHLSFLVIFTLWVDPLKPHFYQLTISIQHVNLILRHSQNRSITHYHLPYHAHL